MDAEDVMEKATTTFSRKLSKSTDKLTTIREQSQSSHINRIRCAIQKRERMQQLNLGLTKRSYEKSSNAITRNDKSANFFTVKNELFGAQVNDSNLTNRFLTLHVKKPYCRFLKHSGDIGNGDDDPQNGMHTISTSKTLNFNKEGSKKRRKQWSKTTKAMSGVTLAGTEHATERNGGDGYSEKSLTVKNVQKFNNIQNEKNKESSEFVEKRRPPAETGKVDNVAQWVESLPPPKLMDSILDTSENALQDIFSEKKDSHSSSKERLTGQKANTYARCRKDVKCGKKSPRKETKHTRDASGLCEKITNKCAGENDGLNSPSKKERLNGISLKAKKDNPIQAAYTPNGNLKIVICLKMLKPKDSALLVKFNNFKSYSHRKENAISSRKIKKGFTYLNNQQMEFFEKNF